ncbi:MAG: Ig-like domain-containing protein [Chloroflexi bacterium]|nr:Ig-like domain-containing protein [Chloroflexota bacterium]
MGKTVAPPPYPRTIGWPNRIHPSFTAVLTDASGDTLALPAATTFVPPFLLEHTPGKNATNVSPAISLVFNFDRPIDPTSVQAAITITPTITGAFTLEGNSLIFVPSEGYLHPSTTYRVKLATTALSAEGKPLLLTPYRFSFTTGELKSEVNFGWGTHVQVVDSEGRRALQFQTSLHNGDLTLELAALNQSQFMAFYPQALYENLYGDPLLLETDLPVTYHWDMTLDAAQLNQYDGIGELLIPADIPPGLYLLTIRRGYEHDQILVALSQNALVVKKGMRQMTAWVRIQ